MPKFQYNHNKKEAKKRLSILRKFKDKLARRPTIASNDSICKFIHLYFEGELKADYFITWCAHIYQGLEVDRVIVINDCSFSRVFTKELMDLLSVVIPDCEIVYLIRDENMEYMQSNKWEALSFEILDMLIHEDRNVLGYKTDIKSANCVIVIPHSAYLRRELSPDGVTVILNVRSCYSNLLDEERLMERYYLANRCNSLLAEFEEELKNMKLE